ncbi:Hypothetical protein FKW44_013137, partial [Caligus rogercresseyi]
SFIMPGGRPRTPSADEKEEKRKERKKLGDEAKEKGEGEEEEKDIDVGRLNVEPAKAEEHREETKDR